MSKNTILCKCLICLKQNKNGILISMRTYNRHRKNQQEFLDIGEININHQEQNIEEEDLYQQEDLYNFTESADDDIMKIFTTNNLSLYKIKKYLKDITNLIPVFYDMCENSCICYTGHYEFYQNCPICNSTRFDTKGKTKKIMPYLSIKNRLQIQFNDENRAKELLYHHKYILNKEQNDNDLDNIFDGKIYKELVEENLFNDKREIIFKDS